MLHYPMSRDIGGKLYVHLYPLRKFCPVLARDQGRVVKTKCPMAVVRRIHIQWSVEFISENEILAPFTFSEINIRKSQAQNVLIYLQFSFSWIILLATPRGPLLPPCLC